MKLTDKCLKDMSNQELLLQYVKMSETEEVAVKMLAKVRDCPWLDNDELFHMQKIKAELDCVFARIVKEIANRDMSDTV